MSNITEGDDFLDSPINKARFTLDLIHRAIMHHAMWYAEVQHQFGREKAMEILKNAFENSYDLQIKRLAKVLDIDLEGNIPSSLVDMPEEKHNSLQEKLAANWLANDGIWFQTIEFSQNMFDAKRCNDSTWGQFSPFEAYSIKNLLNLPEKPGLEGLKRALAYRLYSCINKQSISEETENSFVFSMNECRVQAARKRKGLDDYPCKSGGMVEYTTFASTIDPGIRTECIGCPPDSHPEEWFCSWKFSI